MAESCLAEFADATPLIRALYHLRDQGYERLDAYTPHPIEGLSEALGLPRSRVPRYTLAGGLIGGISAYWFQWWSSAVDYPINVGGRPPHSAPAFIPITFELAVLCGGIATVIGLLIEARLGALWRPVDELPGFESSSIDRFWLAIDARDPKLSRPETETLLGDLGAVRVEWIGGRR